MKMIYSQHYKLCTGTLKIYTDCKTRTPVVKHKIHVHFWEIMSLQWCSSQILGTFINFKELTKKLPGVKFVIGYEQRMEEISVHSKMKYCICI
jgi:hypothetical protein